MKTTAFVSSTALVLLNASSGYASIGQAIKLFTDFTADGIYQTANEVDNRGSKRSIAPIDVRDVPGVRQEEYNRCKEAASGVTITVTPPCRGQ